ncbi:tRNA lysidine(34) synthetase TilS [Pseudoxanthomonas broegbernensis]|uniref:tRNA(Ile)-lysidine synthase n=1 Tax=Pseudoxanthomonas broegbernensis TaxID=83619 RepID=A0A7V8GM86_9GAMM|nr:tRNA lysidine(34) synthetase TilS [Pseudoxanthomonas broegbernensis]KAF1686234.1 tRNA lysidine(34) synthetase TilS [Pseudoxanthomonas broegbernensis]MBB6063903.1 tRNA(Ile)-lysidine synthase [Pseudoxanthomonas broegbernensis]
MPPHLPLGLDTLQGQEGAWVVGFSGGLDSTALLHRLAAEPGRRPLRAVHVHHGLQPAADAWAEHCRQQALQLGVPFELYRVEVPHRGGAGLEAAARAARYAALGAAMAPGDVLVTAHHLDDQAETFLLRALRASGPEGLGAMRPLRRLGHGWHWRPLLSLARETLHEYARAHGLEWIEDPSNARPDPDRNYLRLHVLPLLRERWPHADAALARSAGLCAQADELLDADDVHLLRLHAGDDPHTLCLAGLGTLPAARRARVLRLWVRRLGLPRLPGRSLEQVECELLDARADAQAAIVWAGARMTRWRGFLHADVLRDPLPPEWSAPWDGRDPLDLPGGGRLFLRDDEGHASGAGFAGPLRVHARRGGERIVLPGRGHSHALKHVLQARGVPPWRRAHLPLLSDAGGRLLAAGDVAWADDLARWLRARHLHLVWQPPRTAAAPR